RPSRPSPSRVPSRRARPIARSSCWHPPHLGRAGRTRRICSRPRHRTAPRCSSAGARRWTPRRDPWTAGSATSIRGGPTTGAVPGTGPIPRWHRGAVPKPPYYFDEAALFYQSVLGLLRHDSVELADPYGLVRSQALTSMGGAIRLVLNVPAIGGGLLPESAHFQHIAFACHDNFAAPRAMRNRGPPGLAIPGNYYDDLPARLGLAEARIEPLRAHGILYDRDEGAEFFHFYTTMLGRRMFFEFVQRVNGYQGYGASNTTVRMAAQYRHMAMAGL